MASMSSFWGGARSLSVVVTVLLVGACASNPDKTDDSSKITADRFESYNRAMFAFNKTADTWVLKPVAKGYKKVAPEPVEVGVANFFDNLGEVGNAVNDILQWKWGQAGNDSGRFLINSTVGVLGLFDVAKHAGLEESAGEDFGQTLNTWGVPQGPYIVLPLLGPATASSAGGLAIDWELDPILYLEDDTARYALSGLRLVDLRASLLEAEELISGDEYIFIRDAFLQRREYLINDGKVEDDFGSEAGEEQSFDF